MSATICDTTLVAGISGDTAEVLEKAGDVIESQKADNTFNSLADAVRPVMELYSSVTSLIK